MILIPSTEYPEFFKRFSRESRCQIASLVWLKYRSRKFCQMCFHLLLLPIMFQYVPGDEHAKLSIYSCYNNEYFLSIFLNLYCFWDLAFLLTYLQLVFSWPASMLQFFKCLLTETPCWRKRSFDQDCWPRCFFHEKITLQSFKLQKDTKNTNGPCGGGLFLDSCLKKWEM